MSETCEHPAGATIPHGAGWKCLDCGAESLSFTADEIESLRAEVEVLRLELAGWRMCVNCGKQIPAEAPQVPLMECTDPETGLAACTWDATPAEAWQFWRKKAHNYRAEVEAERVVSKRWRLEAEQRKAEVESMTMALEGANELIALRDKEIAHTLAQVERLTAERDAAVAAEREACEKVCEELRNENYSQETDEWVAGTLDCAAAIRARGEQREGEK